MALNLTARLGLDGSGFSKGVTKAKSQARNLKSVVGKQMAAAGAAMAGAFAVAAIGQQIAKTIEWGTRIRDLGTQFGVSTGFVQKMDYAFKQTGTDSEVAFKSMRKMMLAQSIATNELTSSLTAATKIQAFERMGVSLAQLKSMGPEKLFMQIAANLKDANMASGDLHDALNVVFGKAGSQLLVTFGNDLAAMSARMEELGIVEDAAIQRLGAMGDKMEEFKTQNRGLWADMVNFFGETWMGFVNLMSASIDEVAELIVGLIEAQTKMGNAFATIMQGLTSGNKKQLALGLQMARNASAEFGKLKPQEIGHRVTARMEKKNTELEGRLAQKKDQQALNEKMQAAANIEKDRAKVAEELAKLADEDGKRRFDALSTAQQLLHLEMKLAGERAKMAKLPALHTEEAIDAAVKGLGKVEALQQRQAMEEENLARKEAEKEVALGVEAVTKKREETKKAAPHLALAGEARFGALARIGGKLGGRNPVLDTAKKQLKVSEEIALASLETAAAVGEIAGTK